MAERGQPKTIRCDNGPELTSRHFLAWSVERQIELVHIQPGKPTQNAHVESFHGQLLEECLTLSWFQNLFDARRKIAAWRKEYNEKGRTACVQLETSPEVLRLTMRDIGPQASSALKGSTFFARFHLRQPKRTELLAALAIDHSERLA